MKCNHVYRKKGKTNFGGQETVSETLFSALVLLILLYYAHSTLPV